MTGEVLAIGDVGAIPTAEQINIEHALANAKAGEAVQHAINCGLMLLKVKASLPHGGWLPWLTAQRESGAIEFAERTARTYMHVASNRQRAADLERPSIRAALELLSDKEEAPEQSGLDLETAQEREAREAAEERARAAEAALSAANSEKAALTQRSDDWKAQAQAEKKKREEAETAARLKAKELQTLKASVEATAERMADSMLAALKEDRDMALIDKAEAEQKLKELRKQQDSEVASRTQQALQAQQDEINRREAQLRAIEGRIEFLNARLVKVDSQDAVVAHFEQVTKEIRATLLTLGHQIQVAIDPEEAPFLPSPFVGAFERLAEQLEQGAAGVRGFLSGIDVRQLEILTNG